MEERHNRAGEVEVGGSRHHSLEVEEVVRMAAAGAEGSVPGGEEVLGYSSRRPVEEGGSVLGEEDNDPAEEGDTVVRSPVGEVALYKVVSKIVMIDDDDDIGGVAVT